MTDEAESTEPTSRVTAAVSDIAAAEAAHRVCHDHVVSAARHVAALRDAGWTFRRIESATGIAESTSRGWLKRGLHTGEASYIPIGRSAER